MHTCQRNVSKVTPCIVVTRLQSQVGIGIAVVITRTAGRGRVHISQQQTRYMMLLRKRVVIVEMAVPGDGLTIGTVGHRHITCHHLIVLLCQADDLVLCVIVTPGRNKHSILVIIRKVIAGRVVNREQRLERQTVQEPVHVIDDTGIELELTAHLLRLTAEVAVCDGVILGGFGTAGEILAVEQVKTLAQDGQRLGGIRVHHVDINQRSSVLREIRATVLTVIHALSIHHLYTGSLRPEVALILMFIIEGSARIGKTLDQLVDHQVHITPYRESVRIVILGITEIQEVFTPVVVDVRVEVGTLSAALNLQCTFTTVIHLADILVRVIVHVRIAVRIQARGMVIDVLLAVLRHILVTHGQRVVGQSFVIECHVLCTPQILRELLGYMETSVGIGLNLKAVHFATLGSNQDGTLGTLGTIEYDGLCTLQEGHLLDLTRQHVVRRTLHTVDDNDRHIRVVVIVQTVIVHTPKVVAVPATDKCIHVFKTTHRVILLRQLFHVYVADTTEQMVGIHVAESHMHFFLRHNRIAVCFLRGLSIPRHRHHSPYGQEKYISYYLFHTVILLLCL